MIRNHSICRLRLGVTAGLALLLFGSLALAQERRERRERPTGEDNVRAGPKADAPRDGNRSGRFRGRRSYLRRPSPVAEALHAVEKELTDDQKAAVKKLNEANMEQHRKLGDQIRELRDQWREAREAGKEQRNEVAAKQKQLEEAFVKQTNEYLKGIKAVLTADQRETFVKTLEKKRQESLNRALRADLVVATLREMDMTKDQLIAVDTKRREFFSRGNQEDRREKFRQLQELNRQAEAARTSGNKEEITKIDAKRNEISAAMKADHDKFLQAVKSVLTEEQRETFDQIYAKKRQEWMQRLREPRPRRFGQRGPQGRRNRGQGKRGQRRRDQTRPPGHGKRRPRGNNGLEL